MIDRNRFESLADALTSVDDLDAVIKAVAREKVIRTGMADTGESREIISELLDAQVAMDQEGVLSLTEGEPTTLVDALKRYVSELESRGTTDTLDALDVADGLTTILEYPWPGEEERLTNHGANTSLRLTTDENDDRDLVVEIGGWEIARVSWQDAGSGGVVAARTALEALHRAILARVIPDRDHDVQLGRDDVNRLTVWLTTVPCSGSLNLGRVTLDACEGGGVIVRTRPYTFQYNVVIEQERLRAQMNRNTR